MSLIRIAPAAFVVLWATGFIGARYAMPYAEPFWFLFLRFVLAAALLLAIGVAIRSRRLDRKRILHAIVAGALIHGIYLGGVFWAIAEGMPTALVALIIGLQPLGSALLAGPFLGEHVLPRHWLGLGVGLVGVLLVLVPKLGEIGGGVGAATLAATVVAMLSMSAGTIWQKRFAGGTELVPGTMWQYIGGAAVCGLGALAFETREVLLSAELVFAMAWLVLVLSIGAIFLLMLLIREGEVSKVASLFYLVPAVTAVMAWLLFDEILSPVQIAGMVVWTIGVGLATYHPVARDRASL